MIIDKEIYLRKYSKRIYKNKTIADPDRLTHNKKTELKGTVQNPYRLILLINYLIN